MKLHTINLRRRLWADTNDWAEAHPVMFAVAGFIVGGIVNFLGTPA